MNIEEQICWSIMLTVLLNILKVSFCHFNKVCVYAINCSDVQSVQISSTTSQTTDVHRTTPCNRCDDFEQQDFCRLPQVTIHRRLHVTAALHSTTKHFYQRTEVAD